MAGWRDAIGTPDKQEAPASSGGWRDAIGAVGQSDTQTGSGDQKSQANPSVDLGTAFGVASELTPWNKVRNATIEPLGEKTAEGIGYLGYPKTGAAIGTAIQMSPEIISSLPNSAPTQGTLPDKVAAMREARTGVPARNFQRLYDDPGAFFAKGDTAKAGEAIGEAKVGSDINLGVQHGDLSTLTPENIQMARAPRVVGKAALQSITDDLDAARKLLPNGTAEEHIALANIHPDTVNKALVESNARLSKLTPGTDQFKAESAIKNNLQNILQNVAPDVKAANANFARLKLRDAFSGSEAITKAGKPSKLAMLAKKIPAAIGGAVGGSLFGTPGAIGGYELGGDLANLYHSPQVAGWQTVLGSYLDKYLNPAVAGAERTIAPAAMTYLQNYGSNGNQQNRK